MRTATRLVAAVLVVFAFLLSAGCSFYSKEQRREMEAIRSRIDANPAAVDALDERGDAPLHFAVDNRYVPLIRWLLDHGASVNVRDRTGRTPLDRAVLSGPASDRSMLRLLLERGADPNSADDQGQTPLHTAAYFGLLEPAGILVERGARVNARTVRGEVPLHYASRPAGYPDVVRLLLRSGSDPDARDNFGAAPLHGAAMIGNLEVARALLNGGAEVDVLNGSGMTPLHLAAPNGRSEMVSLLLDAKADPNARDSDGFTPLYRALHRPAMFYSAERSGPVDTSEAARILRGRGGHE